LRHLECKLPQKESAGLWREGRNKAIAPYRLNTPYPLIARDTSKLSRFSFRNDFLKEGDFMKTSH
jgi:hypothetical protein